MPWCRIRLRSVYSARSTASRDGCAIRAIADKNTHRVAGVQCHQVVGNLREIVSPRTWQQQVPLGQPGPPLLSVDVFAQASRRQIACRRWSDGWLCTGARRFHARVSDPGSFGIPMSCRVSAADGANVG